MEYISASDLERYGYCPLSWWLNRTNEVTSEALREGDRKHEKISEGLTAIRQQEHAANRWELLVISFSVIATALAVMGLSLMPIEQAASLSTFLGIVSIVWIVAAIFMLVRANRLEESSDISFYRNMIVVFAIIATLVAINSITVLGVDPEAATAYEVIALLWLIAACVALYFHIRASRKARTRRDEIDVEGEIHYVGEDSSRLLKSEKYGLSGRPDYILKIDGEEIPVEVKTGRIPMGPLFSHILQVATYCLLMSEENGKRVPYGILRYEHIEHEIDYADELETLLLSKLREMRNLIESGEVHRNHNREGKCRNCSRRFICPEKLV
jgi:CRISPR-associated exonuclease Cas4